jgi:hypothetical protein
MREWSSIRRTKDRQNKSRRTAGGHSAAKAEGDTKAPLLVTRERRNFISWQEVAAGAAD